MQGIGSQLSKNVLGMKFMRKTKDELDKSLTQEKHSRHHFAPASDLLKSSSVTTLETIIEEVPSYGQVIGYKFGRVSFGGFNPVVEENVQKGKWKAVRVHPVDDDDSDMEEAVPSKRVRGDDDIKEEPVYGSLIATCGKQFENKQNSDDDEVEEIPLPPKKRGGWIARRFQGLKNKHRKRDEDEGRDSRGGRRGRGCRKNNNRRGGEPSSKRPRFMKPEEDF